MRNLSRRELECERSGASEKKSRNLYKRQKSDSIMSLNVDKNFDYYLSTDLEKYAGKWIAILDNKIVAAGREFKEVFAKTRAEYPNKRPLFDHVSESAHHFLK